MSKSMMINRYLKAFRFIFFPLYAFSFLVPKDKNVWLFGDHQNRYSGNSKALFLYGNRKFDSIICIWITSDFHLCKKLNAAGNVSYLRWSVKGIYFCLRAKLYFYNVYSNDINYYTSGNATMVNLWHGIPLKHIEFDIKKGAQSVMFSPKFSLIFRFLKPDIYKYPDYVLSTSKVVSGFFSTAFKVPQTRCLPLGYPRCDLFFEKSKASNLHVADLQQNPATKKIVYMPTWRNKNNSFIDDALPDLNALNKVLVAANITFFIKLHPNTKFSMDAFSNIVYVAARQDAYELLQQSDMLITDYSSVYFDYLLLDKEIIFYPFDLEKYNQDDRGFYFDYLSSTPGKKVYSFAELLMQLKNIGKLEYQSEREHLREKFWRYDDGNASQRVYNYFSRLVN